MWTEHCSTMPLLPAPPPPQAQRSDELDIHADEELEVLEWDDGDGWCKGRNQSGQEGYFPQNYVQPSSRSSSPPSFSLQQVQLMVNSQLGGQAEGQLQELVAQVSSLRNRFPVRCFHFICHKCYLLPSLPLFPPLPFPLPLPPSPFLLPPSSFPFLLPPPPPQPVSDVTIIEPQAVSNGIDIPTNNFSSNNNSKSCCEIPCTF